VIRPRRRRGLPAGIYSDELIRGELYSVERLEEHAATLAKLPVTPASREASRRLLGRLRENWDVLRSVHRALEEATAKASALPPAGEWLLDNLHIVEEHVRRVQGDLRPAYSRELPGNATGPLAGLPRIYALAWQFVAHEDSRLDLEVLRRYVGAYQRVQPLGIGELWAVPLVLRLVLLENLRRIADQVAAEIALEAEANAHADVLLASDSLVEPERADLARALGQLHERPAFAVELVHRLRHQGGAAPAALELLSATLEESHGSVDDLIHREQAATVALNTTVRNVFTSLRLIAASDWRAFFEEVSLIDASLRRETRFAMLDFATRDRYRHAIEDLARLARRSELEVTRALIQELRASPRTDAHVRDPGFYLIGGGRRAFEAALGCKLPVRQRLLRAGTSHAMAVYLGTAAVGTVAILAVLASVTHEAGVGVAATCVLVALALFPASEIALAALNRLITEGFPPRHLPRLRFALGPPPEFRTFVVVPTLLTSAASIEEQVKTLEAHYLANPDGEVCFALLSDWRDADAEETADDAALLADATAQIDALNSRHPPLPDGTRRFFLLHRRRQWNPSEGCWMGWERKRGKLHELNRLLRGATDTSFVSVDGSPPEAPAGVRFVVTLDSDTRMPLDCVRRLVATAAHPLNQPQWDPHVRRVVQGYAVFQPRVTHLLARHREQSIYRAVFAGATGGDPYSTAVSDVYQDLFGEGNYMGKGLYDVDAFERATAGRVPDNSVLSHDLFEGILGRCALVSDIELFDDFPSHAEVAATRLHRWARGDWQLLPWIAGARARSISSIGRWKMIDNLRRSLNPIACVALLLASWAIPAAPHGFWLGFVLLALGFPPFFNVLVTLIPRGVVEIRPHAYAALVAARTALIEFVFSFAFLAQQAWLMLDAMVRTLVRLTITRKHLLEWVTAAQAKEATGLTLRSFVSTLQSGAIVLVVGAGVLVFVNPRAAPLAAPLLVIWWLVPLVARRVSEPHAEPPPTASDAATLTEAARRIWHFFATFVTAEEHFLPPDNFQEDPVPTIAHRTSPTNIGVYLLSAVAARDFGWIGWRECAERVERTFGTLAELPRHNGHFLNWHDTRTLASLVPEYVSTVDSGNLAGHLLALAQACVDARKRPFISRRGLNGLADTLRLLERGLNRTRDIASTAIDSREAIAKQSDAFRRLATPEVGSITDWAVRLGALRAASAVLAADVRAAGESGEALEWAERLALDTAALAEEAALLAPWATLAPAGALTTEQSAALDEAFPRDLELEQWPARCQSVRARLAHAERLANALTDAEAAARDLFTRFVRLEEQARVFAGAMDFSFLYDTERRLFSIGYRIADRTLDGSHYDLLASEARLASFIAIAKRDVPAQHWLQLGRPTAWRQGGSVLLSWSGSMFEYLMPELVMAPPQASAIGRSASAVVREQIEYGRAHGIPWGVSESAFHARDRQLNYQYSNFGLPHLGLKRGLERDLVIAPYATALAAMVDASAAAANLARLAANGAFGRYGPYEAVDYTRERLPESINYAVIRAYFAHHQGMSLIAITNVLCDGVFRRRFYGEAMVRAAELLLEERPPQHGFTFSRTVADRPPRIQLPAAVAPIGRRLRSPHTASPVTQVLSNGTYAVMASAAGGGYSKWERLAVTRWRPDATLDAAGTFIFLRDRTTDAVWSATYQPTAVEPDEFEARFSEDSILFERRDGTLATALEIVVSPEDNTELRRLVIENHGDEAHEIEVTSYAEVVLTELAADIAHPAFANLFVETEYAPQFRALLAARRARSSTDQGAWLAHLLARTPAALGTLQYETDRARFLGREGSLRAPRAVCGGGPLSNTVGPVLDPIVSLRVRLSIPAGERSELVFVTTVARTRAEVLAAADKYQEPAVFERVSSSAWTQAQVLLRHLDIDVNETRQFQELAAQCLYPDPAARASGEFGIRNRLPTSALWRFGISGDLPIVVVSIADLSQKAFAWQMLRAHEYWRAKRLAIDLVFLNERGASYLQDVEAFLQDLIRARQATAGHETHEPQGGVAVVRADLATPQERLLLLATARVVLDPERGSLVDQVRRVRAQAYAPAPPVHPAQIAADAPQRRSTYAGPPLQLFNGTGGFSADGREYVVIQADGERTPAPWVNVIANESFGTVVSASGSAFSWAQNSREHQLTPWSNDPVTDASGEACYVRDDESGRIWSPAPLPIRVPGVEYVTRHGQGYTKFESTCNGIATEWLQLVAPADPLKVLRLALTNRTRVRKRLSVTHYFEWVLGSARAQTASELVTEWDETARALFARNPLSAEFNQRIAFAALARELTSYTGDRREFLGRHGDRTQPAALRKGAGLSPRVGAALDPCAALQTEIALAPGERVEVVALLGEANDREEARDLIERYRTLSVDEVLTAVRDRWNDLLDTLTVKTPDRALDLMLNRWLLYQTVSCRLWGRSAFYQSGGAFGFRDQLQDAMALALTHPSFLESQCLAAAAHQFEEGDVQHWWHPPRSRGVRTRCSDDLLWLPFATAHYIETIGDETILASEVPFLRGPPLAPEASDAYFEPEVSPVSASLYEHCARALDARLSVGRHGLPLIGSGDWNDGMNEVGEKGEGESVWLAWFLYANLVRFAPFAEQRGESTRAQRWRAHADSLRAAVEEHGWDGAWYRRAFFDDGTPLGTAQADECRIDSIAQSWSVISGAADPERARRAMQSMAEYLIRAGDELALLLTPPFNRAEPDPGYIRGYVPGVRENGGQYSHAAAWCAIAYALLGESERAVEILAMINPIQRARTRSGVASYRVEPYVTAADIYSESPHVRRGGWTWYTGSAGWLYRAAVEWVLGIKKRGTRLIVQPCLPRDWPGFEAVLKFGDARYEIVVRNGTGPRKMALDGRVSEDPHTPIELIDDGSSHRVTISFEASLVPDIKPASVETTAYRRS
jgi:cyclic beta-1,2-glucan synthetase